MATGKQHERKPFGNSGQSRLPSVQGDARSEEETRRSMDQTMKMWTVYNSGGLTPADEFGRL